METLYDIKDLIKPVKDTIHRCHTIKLHDFVQWLEAFTYDVENDRTEFNDMDTGINCNQLSIQYLFLINRVWENLNIYYLRVEIDKNYEESELELLINLIEEVQGRSFQFISISVTNEVLDLIDSRESEQGYNSKSLRVCQRNLEDNLKIYSQHMATIIYNSSTDASDKETIASIGEKVNNRLRAIQEENSLSGLAFEFIFMLNVDDDILQKLTTVYKNYKFVDGVEDVTSEFIDLYKTKSKNYENFKREAIEQNSVILDIGKEEYIINKLLEIKEYIKSNNCYEIENIFILDKCVTVYQKAIDDLREALYKQNFGSELKSKPTQILFNKSLGEDDISEEYDDYLSYYADIITIFLNKETIEKIILPEDKNHEQFLISILFLQSLAVIMNTNSRVQISVPEIYEGKLHIINKNLNDKNRLDSSSKLYRLLSDLTVNDNSEKINNLQVAFANVNYDKNGGIREEYCEMDAIGLAWYNCPKLFAVDIKTIYNDAIFVSYNNEIETRYDFNKINLCYNWSLKDNPDYKIPREKMITINDLFDIHCGGLMVLMNNSIKSIEVLPVFEALIYCYQKCIDNLRNDLINDTILMRKTPNAVNGYENTIEQQMKPILLTNKTYKETQLNLDNFIKTLNNYFTQIGEDYQQYITLSDYCCFKITYKDGTEKVCLGYAKFNDSIKFRPISINTDIEYLNRTEVNTTYNTSLYTDLYLSENDEIIYNPIMQNAIKNVIDKTTEVTESSIGKVLKLEDSQVTLTEDILRTSYEMASFPEKNIGLSDNRLSNYRIELYYILQDMFPEYRTQEMFNLGTMFNNGSATIVLTKYDNSIYEKYGEPFKNELSDDIQNTLTSYLCFLISNKENAKKHKLLVDLTINNSGDVVTPFGLRNTTPSDIPFNSNGILKDNPRFYTTIFTRKVRTKHLDD